MENRLVMRFIYILIFTWSLLCRRSNGICTKDDQSTNLLLKCESTNIHQLFSFYYENNIDSFHRKYDLSIRYSNMSRINDLPHPKKLLTSSIRITESQLTIVNPTIFENLGYIRILNFSYNNISDISFLRAAHFVEEIILSHNKIEYLDASHFRNEYLYKVDFSYNNIKTVAYDMPSLRLLNLSHNYITDTRNVTILLHKVLISDISFNNLQSFSTSSSRFYDESHTSINARNNNITECDINKAVESIDLSDNNIQVLKFSYNDFRYLDLSNTTSKILDLIQGNNLIISHLALRRNNIQTLNSFCFKDLSVNILDLSHNKIEHFRPHAFLQSNIRNLFLNYNNIKQLNVSSFKGLSSIENLNISNNPIRQIDESTFHSMSSIRFLNLSNCTLKTLHKNLFRNLTELSVLDLSYNILNSLNERIFENLNLCHLDLSHNHLKILLANTFSGLKVNILDLGYNKNLIFSKNTFNNSVISELSIQLLIFEEIDSNYLVGLNSISTLNLSSCGIEILHHNAFDDLKALKFLNLEYNKIESLPKRFLSGQTNLESLSLTGNNIIRIHQEAFSYQMTLRQLNITLNGELLGRRLGRLVHLEELNIVNSTFTIIRNNSFCGLVSLKKVYFMNSTVLKIEPGAFNCLYHLRDIDFQPIKLHLKKIEPHTFRGLSSLEHLSLSNKWIEVIMNNVFSDLPNLEHLNLSFNNITDLPQKAFRNLEHLKILDLSHNNLTGKQSTFPIGIFRDLFNLIELHLQFNRIIKIHIGEFTNLNNLQFLNLSNNHLSYLDRHLLFPLKSLRVLDINSNNVIKFDYEFSIKHLQNLKMIGLGSNKWRCDNLTIMLSAFEKKNVNYIEISNLEFDIENIDGIYCVYVCNYLYCPTEEDLDVAY